jgi:uncharacterized protein YdeI (YjbR/CyaY-like superfamily)
LLRYTRSKLLHYVAQFFSRFARNDKQNKYIKLIWRCTNYLFKSLKINKMNTEIQPIFFENASLFREWLEKNHQTETALYVGYYKVNSGKTAMTWSESVDEALCFGWIDGIRKSLGAESYCNRFTPRRRNSIWSPVNIKKIAELTEKGLMKPAGLAAFALRKEDKSQIYAYKQGNVQFSEEFEQKFKENETAWTFFQSLPASYQKMATNWVITAKQNVTQIKRLEELIADSAAGRRIKSLSYAPKK